MVQSQTVVRDGRRASGQYIAATLRDINKTGKGSKACVTVAIPASLQDASMRISPPRVGSVLVIGMQAFKVVSTFSVVRADAHGAGV